jgi:hypothetical protein
VHENKKATYFRIYQCLQKFIERFQQQTEAFIAPAYSQKVAKHLK